MNRSLVMRLDEVNEFVNNEIFETLHRLFRRAATLHAPHLVFIFLMPHPEIRTSKIVSHFATSGGTAWRRCWRYQRCNTRSRSMAAVSGRTCDNLSKDETLALAVDAAVHSMAQNDWRSNRLKVKAVKNAMKAVLNDDDARADEVLELVKNQNEY